MDGGERVQVRVQAAAAARCAEGLAEASTAVGSAKAPFPGVGAFLLPQLPSALAAATATAHMLPSQSCLSQAPCHVRVRMTVCANTGFVPTVTIPHPAHFSPTSSHAP